MSLLSSQASNAEEYQISDDSWAHVPLDFAFPYQGRVFTDSYMFSNGVVGFLDPTNGFCCNAFDLNNPDPSMSFSLFVLQTDLIDNGPGTFTAVGDSSSMTYSWNDIAEYGTNNLNTFSASIYSTGNVEYNYTNINLAYHNAAIGYTGDVTQGEYYSYAVEPPNTHVNIPSTVYIIGDVNICDSDPLYDVSCPGYLQAYLLLQCSYDALYDPQCEGYENAYYAQQCYNNPLYDSGCAGYAIAYYNQQCSLDPLYDSGCDGFEEAYFQQQCSISPLYNSSCTGYDTAYHNLQCSIDPLYATDCDGYSAAYHLQQCSVNPLYATDCFGYEEAYYNQQCSINPLYDSGCNGYNSAYFQQQCSLNTLYDSQCPGYDEAYYSQQCSLDPLYDSGCDGYQIAYDAYMLDQVCIANKQADSRCPGYTTATLVETTVGTVMVFSVTDPVAGVIAEYSTGTLEPQQEETKTELVEISTGNAQEEKKDEAPPTKVETSKAVKEEAKAAAKEMASAKTVEAQQKAQESVLAMLGYVPGFGAYSVVMDGGSYDDTQFYEPQNVPESKSGLRNGLAQQILFTEMVQQQYEKTK